MNLDCDAEADDLQSRPGSHHFNLPGVEADDEEVEDIQLDEQHQGDCTFVESETCEE